MVCLRGVSSPRSGSYAPPLCRPLFTAYSWRSCGGVTEVAYTDVEPRLPVCRWSEGAVSRS